MLQLVLAIGKNIVEVYYIEIVEVSSKGFINVTLKGYKAIIEFER